MKNLKLSILIIALVAIVVTGCKKAEDVYSCDPKINEWVKSNSKSIEKMNRQDLLELEDDYRAPALHMDVVGFGKKTVQRNVTPE